MSELPDSNEQEAARWLDQARGDLAGARVIDSSEGVPARLACFLAHLTAEKALKSCLIDAGEDPTRNHDLLKLRALLDGREDLGIDTDDLALLNPWTIDGRYPDDLDAAAESDARSCIAAAERIVDAVTKVLRS